MLLLSWRDLRDALAFTRRTAQRAAPRPVQRQQRGAACFDDMSAARYSLRSRGAQAAAPRATSPGVTTGAAPSALGASLQDMPYEVLMRILSHASAGGGLSAETLFRLGGLCSAFRRACGSVEDSALAVPLVAHWARAVINLVDPAAALLAESSARHHDLRSPASCYLAHARLLGGWYELLHALAERRCAACGDVTRLVAWRDGDDDGVPFGLCRCCAGCTPPEAGSDESGDDVSHPDIRCCAVMNAYFWSAEPKVVLNAADFESPAERLKACIEEAVDGDTIGLRSDFTCASFRTPPKKAVRLLGIPVSAPYRWKHEDGPLDVSGPGIMQMRTFELECVAELGGFPSASIHVERNCFEAYAAWLENIFISSGPRHMGSKRPVEHDYNDIPIHSSVSGEAINAFPGITVFKPRSVSSSSMVLRRCWLTGYFGTSLTVTSDCSAALLRCVVTNSRSADTHCLHGSALRMHGCRVLCSGELQQDLNVPDTFALPDALRALFTSENYIFRFARRSHAAHCPCVPERITAFRTFFDPRRVRLLT